MAHNAAQKRSSRTTSVYAAGFVGNPVDTTPLMRPRTTLLGVTFASSLHSFGMQTSEFRPRGAAIHRPPISEPKETLWEGR